MEWRYYSTALHYSNLLRHITPLLEIRRSTAVKLSYKIIGEGNAEPYEPPVLILHALLGSKKRWKSLGKTIVNMTKRSVITVDLRNHGYSPHVNSHKYEELSADVLRLYKRLGIKRASLVAHGMGGRTAMYLSLKNVRCSAHPRFVHICSVSGAHVHYCAPPVDVQPKKVAGLLIQDISPVSFPDQYKNEFPIIMEAMKTVDFKDAPNVYRAMKFAKKKLKKVIKDEVVMNTVLSNIRMMDDGTIQWTCNLDALLKEFKYIVKFPKSVRTKKFYGPTYFVGGQWSDFLPPDDLNNIRSMFPRAVITYVPKTGHYVHIDDPKSFMEITIAFLRSIKSKILPSVDNE